MSAAPRSRSTPWVGLFLGAAPLSALGTLLFKATHHRPLGAVTFALLAAGVLAFALLVAHRCAQHGGKGWLACRVASAVSGLGVVVQLLLALVAH